MTPRTTNTPPPAAATVVPTTAAAAPCSASDRRGPPATTTVNTPCSLPRSSSDAACCRIVDLNADDTISAAPPIARNARAIHSQTRAEPSASPQATPKPTIATPQTTIATTTVRPCRRIRGNQPENTPPDTAPTAIAAASNVIVVPPSTGPPKL